MVDMFSSVSGGTWFSTMLAFNEKFAQGVLNTDVPIADFAMSFLENEYFKVMTRISKKVPRHITYAYKKDVQIIANKHFYNLNEKKANKIDMLFLMLNGNVGLMPSPNAGSQKYTGTAYGMEKAVDALHKLFPAFFPAVTDRLESTVSVNAREYNSKIPPTSTVFSQWRNAFKDISYNHFFDQPLVVWPCIMLGLCYVLYLHRDIHIHLLGCYISFSTPINIYSNSYFQ